jgi:hypothetical protein
VEVLDGEKHRKGTCRFQNGGIYEGEKREKGICRFHDGDGKANFLMTRC